MNEITNAQAVAAVKHGLVKQIEVAGKTFTLKEDGIEGYPQEDFMYRGMQWTITDSDEQDWLIHMFLYQDGHYEAAIQRKGSEAPAKIFASGSEIPSWEHLKAMAFAKFEGFEEYEKEWTYAFSDYEPDDGPEVVGGHVIDTLRLNDDGEFLCVVEYELADGEAYHEIMYVGLEDDYSAFTTGICLVDSAGKDTVDVLRTYPMKEWTKLEEGMKLDAVANSVDVWLSHTIKDELPGYGEKEEGSPYPTKPAVFDGEEANVSAFLDHGGCEE